MSRVEDADEVEDVEVEVAVADVEVGVTGSRTVSTGKGSQSSMRLSVDHQVTRKRDW